MDRWTEIIAPSNLWKVQNNFWWLSAGMSCLIANIVLSFYRVLWYNRPQMFMLQHWFAQGRAYILKIGVKI